MNHGYEDDDGACLSCPLAKADEIEDYNYPPPNRAGPSGLLAQLIGGGFGGFNRNISPRSAHSLLVDWCLP